MKKSASSNFPREPIVGVLTSPSKTKWCVSSTNGHDWELKPQQKDLLQVLRRPVEPPGIADSVANDPGCVKTWTLNRRTASPASMSACFNGAAIRSRTLHEMGPAPADVTQRHAFRGSFA